MLPVESIGYKWREWVDSVKNAAIKHIDFQDANFFVIFKRSTEIIKFLKANNISWEANSRADAPFSDEYISFLEDSKCKLIAFGFESIGNKTLKAINKKTTATDNRKINELFSKYEINTVMSFIVGFPGETPTDFHETEEYLLNEHYGDFTLYVFEMEDESMPIWQDRHLYDLKILKDENSWKWEHSGKSWVHCGMSSKQAEELRVNIIKKVRMNSVKSIHRSWQRRFEWPFIEDYDRKTNLKIEKLIDKLVFINNDYPEAEKKQEIIKIMNELRNYSIYPLF